MRKSIFILISILVLAAMLAGCAQESEVGDAVLTITGDIGKTNSGEKYVFDEARFEEHSVDLVINDVWMGDGQEYKGVLLSDIIDIVKPGSDVTTVSVVAVDGKSADVAIEDAKNMDILMVHYLSGEILGDDVGGPVKIAFGADAQEVYPDESWMWWVAELKFK
ncbi:MAG: hypothetical protein K8R77_10725 [Anaerolineaceae bacterium]|nr:hypothetical protein [Anaerolineaceae bacterium]